MRVFPEVKPERGVLWPAKTRETDKHPHHRGFIRPRCPGCNTATLFWLSAWEPHPKRKGKNPPTLRLACNPVNTEETENE